MRCTGRDWLAGFGEGKGSPLLIMEVTLNTVMKLHLDFSLQHKNTNGSKLFMVL